MTGPEDAISHTENIGTPDVSFAIACYNAGEFLEQAVSSALAQEGVSVEVLIVDDHSRDGSYANALGMAEKDPRVRVFQTSENGGPSAARNVALENMRGRWYAVLDSDDYINPDRSRNLIDAADRAGADMIADEMRVFGDGLKPHNLVSDPELAQSGLITTELYLDRSRLFSDKPGLGFLKPMIRRSMLDEGPVRYRMDMRVGEDDELVLGLLSRGASYRFHAEPGYHYRKHAGSISHRLTVADASRMLSAETGIRDRLDPETRSSKAYRRRFASLQRGLAFVTSIEQVKARKFIGATATLIRSPSAIWLYKMPIKAAIDRKLGRKD